MYIDFTKMCIKCKKYGNELNSTYNSPHIRLVQVSHNIGSEFHICDTHLDNCGRICILCDNLMLNYDYDGPKHIDINIGYSNAIVCKKHFSKENTDLYLSNRYCRSNLSGIEYLIVERKFYNELFLILYNGPKQYDYENQKMEKIEKFLKNNTDLICTKVSNFKMDVKELVNQKIIPDLANIIFSYL